MQVILKYKIWYKVVLLKGLSCRNISIITLLGNLISTWENNRIFFYILNFQQFYFIIK